jgi:diaminopimelate epimerase
MPQNSRQPTLDFVKMHGAGNDYVYVDAVRQTLPSDLPDLARRMSDRHFGIGGDGLILVLLPTDPQTSDVRMQMFNLDGSEGQMCGNGIRCVAKFTVDEDLVERDAATIRVETASGVRQVEVLREKGRVIGATVDMGQATFGVEAVGADISQLEMNGDLVRLPTADVVADPRRRVGAAESEQAEQAPRLPQMQATLVSTGNPHAVVFVDDLDAVDVPTEGPRWAEHQAFPNGINAHFAQVLARDHLRVIHWERGSGPTLACGTGACATLAAAVQQGLADRRARVDVPGGTLEIAWDQATNRLSMTGPAATAFRGTWSA